jgi:hypothetical protein
MMIEADVTAASISRERFLEIDEAMLSHCGALGADHRIAA